MKFETLLRVLVFSALFAAPACAGERPSRGDSWMAPPRDFSTVDAWVAADRGAVDQPAHVDQATSPCSAAGVAATCDPAAATGCAGSTCYVVATIGTACVCPAGKVAEGQPCNTTVECAAGLGCAGKVAPGVCRRFCIMATPACSAGRRCKAIDVFPQFGLCVVP